MPDCIAVHPHFVIRRKITAQFEHEPLRIHLIDETIQERFRQVVAGEQRAVICKREGDPPPSPEGATHLQDGHTRCHLPGIIEQHQCERAIPVTLCQQASPSRMVEGGRRGVRGDEGGPERAGRLKLPELSIQLFNSVGPSSGSLLGSDIGVPCCSSYSEC